MKSVLIIVPFDQIYPPMNGGMQRTFHVIHQLALHFNLTIVINQDKEAFLLSTDEYPAIQRAKVYSTADASRVKDVFNLLPQKLQQAFRYRWYKKRLRGSADGNFLLYYPVVTKLLRKEKFDTVILESPSTLHAVSLIRQYDKEAIIIFDAHNVDSNLAAAFVKKDEISRKKYLSILNTESSLYKIVDALLVCSEKDKDGFDKLNNGNLPISIIPNGVSIVPQLCDESVKLDQPINILFCAYLSTRPNSEGLLWFHSKIWPKIRSIFPALKLMVVGGGNLSAGAHTLMEDKSLVFTGRIDDVKPFYNECTISIVPLKTGSGTRLKILEAMSYGLPVVSTTQGAEGIEYTDGKDILIADEESLFAEKVVQLLQQKEQRIMMQQNARALVKKKYDWNIIGKSLAAFIENDRFAKKELP